MSDLLLLLLGFVTLFLGGEFLVRGSVQIALYLKVSTLVIGATIVSFATSAPELLVSVNASLKGHSDISLGNVIGSNIANIGLVLGLTAIFYSIGVSKEARILHWPYMMIFSLLMILILFFDGIMQPWEGAIAFLILLAFPVLLIRNSRRARAKASEEERMEFGMQTGKAIGFLILGAICLYFGSHWLVSGAVNLAEKWGVGERVISVSVVAVGTSLPELAASFVAAMKKEKALSLGNLLGSNIFNIGAVLGITSMIVPIPVLDEGLYNDLYWMLGFAFLLLPLMLFYPKGVISRWKGVLILTLYILYILSVFY